MRKASRRAFLKSSLTAACSAGFPGGASAGSSPVILADPAMIPPSSLSIKKGLLLGMLPPNLSYADRFKMARDLGFEVVQVPTEVDESKAEEIKKAAEEARICIDSVMNLDHWKHPLRPAILRRW
jgi:hypothetical protein